MKLYNFKNFDEVYAITRGATTTLRFPPYITFELTSFCNFGCLMCSHTYMSRKPGHLDFEIFKKCIDEVAYFGSAVGFIGFSEPFLYPHIDEAVEYVKAKNLLLHITNNGSIMNDKNIESVIRCGVDSMIFSFQGSSKDEYSLMRDTDKYDTVIENIKKIYNKRENKKPFIKISTTVTNRDKNTDEFETIHKDYCDVVQISGFTSFSRVKNDFGRDDILERLSIGELEKSSVTKCYNPNYEALINANGQLSPCCDDAEEKMVIGDVFKNSIKEIWDTTQAQKIREITKEGRFEENENCKNCHIRYRYVSLDGTKNS